MVIEGKYVAMFGCLHIEMNTFGDYLEASSWTTALTLLAQQTLSTKQPTLPG